MKKNGFTLIELMVVMVIVNILIGIQLPHMLGMVEIAKEIQAKKELRTLETGLLGYYTYNDQTYPPSTTTLVDTYLKNETPKLIPKPLMDTFKNTQEYAYKRSGNGKYYVIYSYGLNKIKNITGINNSGTLLGTDVDDIYRTNGFGF